MIKKMLALCIILSSIISAEFKIGSDDRTCSKYVRGFNGIGDFSMDCESFKHVEGDYYRDKDSMYLYLDNNSRYIGFAKLENLNPENFILISNTAYARDDKNIYIYDSYIKEADVKSFEILQYPYSKDKNNVYYYSIKLENVNSNTFKLLGAGYSRDKNNIYYKFTKLKDVDIDTFIISESNVGYSHYYSKDKNNVYYRGEKIKGADPKTHEYIGSFYSRDKNNVYYREEKLKNKKPQTFKIPD